MPFFISQQVCTRIRLELQLPKAFLLTTLRSIFSWCRNISKSYHCNLPIHHNLKHEMLDQEIKHYCLIRGICMIAFKFG